MQNIQTAQQRYDEGRIQDIEPLLINCVDDADFTKAQKAEALRLLVLAYIFLDEEARAEATMLRLLRTYHEFEANPAIDPTEFINLFNRFRHDPVFNIGVKYMVNFSQPEVVGLNSSLDLNGNRPAYQAQFSFVGLGLNFEYEIAPQFFIFPEVHYKTMAVKRTETQTGTASGLPYITVTNYEDQQWLSLPVAVKYLFHFAKTPKFKVYALGGLSADYLLKSVKPAEKNGLQLLNDQDVSPPITTTDDKRRLTFGWQAGAGATYKVGEGFISLDLRYMHSFVRLTRPEKVLQPAQAAQLNTLVQDDIYKLNHIAISIGYTLNIYIPKQL